MTRHGGDRCRVPHMADSTEMKDWQRPCNGCGCPIVKVTWSRTCRDCYEPLQEPDYD